MLDWIFEGIANWVAGIMTQIMDAISGVFLGALGTDMTAMEEYFPFAVSAYTIIQYTAWALLFLIVVWQIFRAFSGPLAETENPLAVVARGAIFALPDRLCKAYFQSRSGYRAGALYRAYGRISRSRRLYFCGNRAGNHKWTDYAGFCSHGCWPDFVDCIDDLLWPGTISNCCWKP